MPAAQPAGPSLGFGPPFSGCRMGWHVVAAGQAWRARQCSSRPPPALTHTSVWPVQACPGCSSLLGAYRSVPTGHGNQGGRAFVCRASWTLWWWCSGWEWGYVRVGHSGGLCCGRTGGLGRRLEVGGKGAASSTDTTHPPCGELPNGPRGTERLVRVAGQGAGGKPLRCPSYVCVCVGGGGRTLVLPACLPCGCP